MTMIQNSEKRVLNRISLLGSTGSIGTQTLDIVRAYPEELKVTALAAGNNVSLMEEQVREFKPRLACLWDEEGAKDLRVRISDTPTKVLSGMDGLLAAAREEEADLVLTAVVGMIGIRPTLAAIEEKKTIALANKETLVSAGHLIMPAAKANGVRILPVDSEHSAIFQCLNGEPGKRLKKIWLTCSGGTFRGLKKEDLQNKKAKDALKNPNWDMGAKVTIDSASLVNKGLEVIEASWLFEVPTNQIRVIVQPQSIIHSMVEYVDGSVIAQLAAPDMHLPIQYALFYPDRRGGESPAGKILSPDFTAPSAITFEEPDTDTFEGLPLAYRAAKAGGSMPTVFNAANEEAVRLFLKDEIGFLEIYDKIRLAMDAHEKHVIAQPDLDEILETEAFARELVRKSCS